MCEIVPSTFVPLLVSREYCIVAYITYSSISRPLVLLSMSTLLLVGEGLFEASHC